MLVLNSKGGWKPAMLINTAGYQKELDCFERDSKTVAYHSCSVIWKTELYIFGGDFCIGYCDEPTYMSNIKQVSRLNGHKLERVHSLDFDFWRGACGVMANKYIFLCFTALPYKDQLESKRCRRLAGPYNSSTEEALLTFHQGGISCSDSKF